MPNLVKSINLTDGDKATLESILHQSTVEARTYIRAKILLLKSECRSNEFIADKLDICVTAVRLCIDKYNTGGIEAALQDNRGRGRKAEITDADRSLDEIAVMKLLQELYPQKELLPEYKKDEISGGREGKGFHEGGMAEKYGYSAMIDQEESRRIIETLFCTGGSREKAAAELGISKATLWRRMKKYGIEKAGGSA